MRTATPAPTRNNRGKSHGNGAAEGPHGHLKRTLADALLDLMFAELRMPGAKAV